MLDFPNVNFNLYSMNIESENCNLDLMMDIDIFVVGMLTL